ncbi:MAG: U32 family peptidase [Bryobacteraceae bacterium]
MRKPEVMSPAGYWPQLRAAVEAGADAVYFGLQHFTARAKVGFTLQELPLAVAALHERGVRGYVTFNTLVFEHEFDEAARAIAAIAKAGADALIVQDCGILQLARTIAPGLELHASTQMSITDSAGVRMAREMGVQRVTLARELSLDQVRRIVEETGCEIEIFVHGALCVAYSGQCFSSEAWGGRSANRGQCAQACRLPYDMLVDGRTQPLGDARYLLSPGDLYALEQVPAIMAAGVAALKIEGRYKDAEYVALATAAYRRAVDGAAVDGGVKQQLEQVYSRGLGPYFLTGTDHQQVVLGRAPRHRGVRAATVTRVGRESVWVAGSGVALKRGDGVVFDAASWRSPEEPEEGGRLFDALPALDGSTELRFGNGIVRFDRIRAGDIVWRTHDPAVERAAKVFIDPSAPVAKQPVKVRVTARVGAPLSAVWTLVRDPAVAVRVESAVAVEAAGKHAMQSGAVCEQLGRLGGTAYVLAEVELDADSDVFVPASVLNRLRRDGVEALAARQRTPRPLAIADAPGPPTAETREHHAHPRIHLLVRNGAQLEAAIAAAPSSITLDYLDLYGLRPSVERVKLSGVAVRVATPRILKPGEARIADFLLSLDCGLLVRAAGMLERFRGAGRELTGDFSLNAANTRTAAMYLAMGLARITPTHDLNAAQVSALASHAGAHRIEAVAYQHLPVFHTEHCVFCRFLSTGTSYRDCGRPCEQHNVALRDREGRAHPVLADVGCRNTVFGAEAQQASRHLKVWREAGIRDFRLEFVHETAEQITAVTDAFRAALAGSLSADALVAALERAAPEGVTEGSLFVPKDHLYLPVLQ